MSGELMTVRGQVQGVGFRPAVWRIATELGLSGDVRNRGDAVEIRLWGDVDGFERRLRADAPARARVETIARSPLDAAPPAGFAIVPSAPGPVRAVMPDLATCDACRDEVRDPFARRYRYPFTNCTQCGPRHSIIGTMPYDRARTAMRGYAMCAACAAEYADPGDRRHHAQPIACHGCGPRAWLERLGGGAVCHESFSMLDDVDAAGGILARGHILAVKGSGGFHLACDATNATALALLRAGKQRPSRAFALMVRDLAVARRYCVVSAQEAALLSGPAAPIVLLRAAGERLPDAVAPGLDRLGVMLAHTPLQHLMLRRLARPVVMTSGNLCGRPPCTGNDEARTGLAGVAAFALMHDRPIAHRIDDSVMRLDLGRPRVLRRARGLAPAGLRLPPGFDPRSSMLAMGGALKNSPCLVQDGHAIMGQHGGDLADAAMIDDAARQLASTLALFGHVPRHVAVDGHPDYAAGRAGREIARSHGLPVTEVQHHHAHVAACLAENGWPLGAGPVLGIVLDGAGLGADGTIWGGEVLACSYRGVERLGCLKPVALLGGDQAAREPWRNAYAHLMAGMGWAELAMNFQDLPVFDRLAALPRQALDAMLANGRHAPLATSCGRLFDAAAALCGLAWDRQDHEGQAAMAFEAAINPAALLEAEELVYPFSVPLLHGRGLPYVEPLGAWRALLGDLLLGTPVGRIAARFHRGLARALVALATRVSGDERRFGTVALSGGCFQNATLFALVHRGLEQAGFEVLSHAQVPCNDGGLSLGQAVVALARQGATPCA